MTDLLNTGCGVPTLEERAGGECIYGVQCTLYSILEKEKKEENTAKLHKGLKGIELEYDNNMR